MLNTKNNINIKTNCRERNNNNNDDKNESDYSKESSSILHQRSSHKKKKKKTQYKDRSDDDDDNELEEPDTKNDATPTQESIITNANEKVFDKMLTMTKTTMKTTSRQIFF
jgi:hypothetical protein